MTTYRSQMTNNGAHVMYFYSAKPNVAEALADMTEQARRFNQVGQLSTPVEFGGEQRGAKELRHYVRNSDGSLDVKE